MMLLKLLINSNAFLPTPLFRSSLEATNIPTPDFSFLFADRPYLRLNESPAKSNRWVSPF